MLEVGRRERELLNDGGGMKSQSSTKSLKNAQVGIKFQQENMKMKERLMQTKSCYYHLHNIKKRGKSFTNRRKEVTSLMENHLGIRPSVVFPNIRKELQQTPSLTKQKKSHVRNYTEHHTEGLNSLKERDTYSVKYSADF